MAVRRGARWALIAIGALLAVTVAALVIAPPFVVRHVLRHYLRAEGITADIGDVDADIFTGQISLNDVRGHGPNGRGFSIGRLAVDIDYWPLLDHHIKLSEIHLSHARIDAGRNAKGQFTVAGVAIPVSSSGGDRSGWGFGVDEISIADVKLHYREPARGDRPAIDQALGIARLEIGPIATWQPKQATEIHTRLEAAGGRLTLDGRAHPLGANWRAQFSIEASDFAMQALSPLARPYYITALGGTFDANQRASIVYHANGELDLDLKGQGRWRDARLNTTGGIAVRGGLLSWQGNEQARLWPTDRQPGRITVNGTVKLSEVKVRRADQLDFSQQSATWTGQATAELGNAATRVTSNGNLDARRTRLTSGDRLALSSDATHLAGAIDLTLTPDATRIDTDGVLTTSAMSFAVPETLAITSRSLDWNGQTTTRLTGNGTQVDADGSLAGDRFVFDIPKTSHMSAGHVDWQGRISLHSAKLFSRRASGKLDADDVHLAIAGAPVTMSAATFGFDGRYAEQPDATGKALRLTVSGSAYSHKLNVMDSAIDAPWARLLEVDVSGIDIDGLGSIGLDEIEASGLRLLGDTDTDSAVVQAVSMKASQFSLKQWTHYRMHSLVLDDVNIHTRRDAGGMGVISRFVGGPSDNSSSSASAKRPDTPIDGDSAGATTFAVDHLELSGPSIAFVDTTVTPTVEITGSRLDFTLDHLDTAKPDQSASYTLGLDVGAYGHLDSRGEIAPFAPGGIRMDLDVWLRSLALPPMSGYLNAAMNRRIANGVADGTLNISATRGQLDGVLDTTLTNLRLADSTTANTDIAFGISMSTALKLLRGKNDIIHFRTKILGDVTNPYFSIDNLIREAVLAGLRTALLSNYSPVGLLNNLKNSFLNLFRSVEDRPAIFAVGKHYVRPDDRTYMTLIAQAMSDHPDWTLRVTGQAVPADARALNLNNLTEQARHARLEQLARMRQKAIQDYLAARDVNPDRILGGTPKVLENEGAKPAVRLSLDKH
ncbi:DUF748 domain-containing protein [Salinisphaera sp.]|uniref:DUF748 domain-containing protein n=1 Tax=Salinisphaera sp. TaxID=1914330 RepID=UPI002D77E397|nr:DUF748 domain-containing protein [Salinisphaera sp.]HET7315395.1 DUF748 domain-containing protein [Salinisphaera sp.]